MENPDVEQNEFTRTENKGKLWQLLQRNGAFNGIDSNYFNKVREEFEINVVKVQNENSNKSVMDRNKLFLDVMINLMKNYKHQIAYTAADIQQTKREAFNNDLSHKQAEFDKFNAKPKPQDVNFADKEEDSGDVNILLEQVIRDRESVGFSHPEPVINKESIQTMATSTISVDSNILQQILDKLTTIEDFISKK